MYLYTLTVCTSYKLNLNNKNKKEKMKSKLEYPSRRLAIILRAVSQYSTCLSFRDIVGLHLPTFAVRHGHVAFCEWLNVSTNNVSYFWVDLFNCQCVTCHAAFPLLLSSDPGEGGDFVSLASVRTTMEFSLQRAGSCWTHGVRDK